MVKDGYINIIGAYIENMVEGDPLPCPRCGSNTEIEVLRDLSMEPTGFRLRCEHCGYEVPEEDSVYAWYSKEGIERAIRIWDLNILAGEIIHEANDVKLLDNGAIEVEEDGHPVRYDYVRRINKATGKSVLLGRQVNLDTGKVLIYPLYGMDRTANANA